MESRELAVPQLRQRLEDTVRAAGWPVARSMARMRRCDATRPERLAVLIHSFDGYKRFWPGVTHFTVENIPSRYPIFFASENTPVEHDRITPLLTGTGSFGRRLLRALVDVQRRGFCRILYLQEDMWVTEPVGAELLEGVMGVMDRHRMDAVKLYAQWQGLRWRVHDRRGCAPELDHRGRERGLLEPEGLGSQLRWWGSLDFSFAHHPTVFRPEFLIEMAWASVLFHRPGPLSQEQFCSAYLKDRCAISGDDRARYRIAGIADAPLIEYTHASAQGQLTDLATNLLQARGLEELFDPTMPGEVFPEAQHPW